MNTPFIRQRGLPPEPDHGNPFEVATQKWDALREYAIKVADVARETDDKNKALQAENDSLHRENARLSEHVDKIARELRATSAFAESMRSRMKAIEEQITAALQDGMEHAQQAMREKITVSSRADELKRVLSNQRALESTEQVPQNKFAANG